MILLPWRLDLHIGQPEPSLDDSRAEMDVLNARVRDVHFAAKEDADFHVNALRIEAVAQRVVAEIKQRQRDEKRGAAEDDADEIELPQRGLRAFEREDGGFVRWRIHDGNEINLVMMSQSAATNRMLRRVGEFREFLLLDGNPAPFVTLRQKP